MNPAQTPELRQLLTLLALAAFASSASFRVCDPMLPVLAGLFDAPAGRVAHIITGFTIAYGAMQLIYGPLGERFDRFRIVTLATALCAVGSLGATLATRLDVLTLCRILTGVAAAGIIPMSIAAIADMVPAEQRQAVLARFFSGQIIGMIFGQLLGGLCVDFGLWRVAFATLTVLYIVIALALWKKAHLGQQTCGKQAGTTHIAGLYLAALKMLYARDTRGVLACFFIEAALVFGMLAFTPLYLHERFGLALSTASLPLLLYGAGGLLFSVFAARLGARLNHWRYPFVAACLVATASGIALLADHPAWLFGGALISGFGYYLLHNTLLFQITQRAQEARSLALALSISLFFLGQSVGVTSAGWLVDQGRLTWVFALAALLMPLLGAVTARQVRAG